MLSTLLSPCTGLPVLSFEFMRAGAIMTDKFLAVLMVIMNLVF